MSLKSAVVAGVRAIGRFPVISTILFQPGIRSTLQSLPGFHILYGKGWELLHPFDLKNGTDTSGYVTSDELPNSPFSSTKLHVYGGSQPSIIRTVLKSLSSLDGYTFIDLGAGKGRPVMVASEFPFKEVIGVELSSPLAEAANKNLEIVRPRFPNRAPVRVENGDAATFQFPPGNLLVFLYNPFGADVIKRVIANIEAALRAGQRTVFVVYYNPVYGECFDASPMLKRYAAQTVPYAAEERGFGPDDADPVVVWQGGSSLPALAGAEAPIKITHPGFRSELVS